MRGKRNGAVLGTFVGAVGIKSVMVDYCSDHAVSTVNVIANRCR